MRGSLEVKWLSHVIVSTSWFLPFGNYNALSNILMLEPWLPNASTGSQAVNMFKVAGRHPMTPSLPSSPLWLQASDES
jgi:hypothetical protein